MCYSLNSGSTYEDNINNVPTESFSGAISSKAPYVSATDKDEKVFRILFYFLLSSTNHLTGTNNSCLLNILLVLYDKKVFV